MAKTFTQFNSTSIHIGETENDLFLVEKDQNFHELICQLKNLRVRPSLSSISNIMEYAKKSNRIELN